MIEHGTPGAGGLSGDARPSALREAVAPLLGDRADAFVAGGLSALAGAGGGRSWVQVGLRPLPGRLPELYAGLDTLASALCEDEAVRGFFFMHKSPGLRVRFEASPGRTEWLRGEIDAGLATMRHLLEKVEPGVYEPEQHLFGGPRSMPYVHRLFTVDARAWLAFHLLRTSTPAWAFSLATLRHLLAGLGVAGWEDLDVWDRIARGTARTLPPGMDAEKVASAGAAIRALWSDPSRLHDALSEPAAALVRDRGPRIADAARAWSEGYFAERGATIGPREGAAFFTIFHWNRGGLPGGVQALVTTALADRSERP
ncbi:thiopeptide-type bacteriocin biosynthesis protein [Streptosporangium sp. OZ121]|uniref:thiopeptide-type bacteriocin biosynthesis protein n=1 Tax=Streptosporangium sp. OZ121 TaxID=3444183 RepID=UPI003F7A87C0